MSATRPHGFDAARVQRAFRPPEAHYFLFGPRGTGKSTWLRSTYPDALWLDLLDSAQEREYSARPERLRERIAALPPAPGGPTRVVVIDEVQRVPALLDSVHALIEARPDLRFVLTGSSARKLRRAGTNLLAGRAVVRSLHPFLAAELGEGFELESALRVGLVPLVTTAPDPADALRAYLGLYLREEIQFEGLVRRIDGFGRFLEAISFSHAAVLNLSEIARDTQTSRKTVEGYLEILEDLLLAFRLPVFARRAKRRLTSHPKFFWFDTGVFNAARPRGVLDRPEEIAGAALEGLVAQHLRGWIEYSRADLDLYFWRTPAGNEVDFVLYGGDGFQAIEVKNSARVRPADLRSLRAFREDYPEADLRLLYRGEERLEIDGILCLPVGEFLRALVPG